MTIRTEGEKVLKPFATVESKQIKNRTKHKNTKKSRFGKK